MSSGVSDASLSRAHVVLGTIVMILGIPKYSQILGPTENIYRIFLPDLIIQFFVWRKPALLPELI